MKPVHGRPSSLPPEVVSLFHQALRAINASNIQFLVGGEFALYHYAQAPRKFKDLDLHCKEEDYPGLLGILEKAGFKTWVEDEKWLAKAVKGKAFVDIIFSSRNGLDRVDSDWFKDKQPGEILGEPVNFVSAEDLIVSKIYIQELDYFAGPDVNQLILKAGERLDWHRILERMNEHWELLFGSLLIFRFIYPSKRNKIPSWLVSELISRLQKQMKEPVPKDPLCRGNLLSGDSYKVNLEDGLHF